MGRGLGARSTALTGVLVLTAPFVQAQNVVPPYVAPTMQTTAPDYIDDTRGVYVPSAPQQRLKTDAELASWQGVARQADVPDYMRGSPGQQGYERRVNTVSTGVADPSAEMDRIAQDPGLLSGGRSAPSESGSGGEMRIAAKSLEDYPSLATGGKVKAAAPSSAPMGSYGTPSEGQQIAGGSMDSASENGLDMQNSKVRISEDRITVRRALQRMMDQIGGGQWTIVWDLDEQNVGLPDMEISLHAEEPFMNVLNALLARLQTRSGQPLRVIRYDQTQRLVITDRQGDNPRATVGSIGGVPGKDVAVTETVLKESMVSLHYDEIPLVDALENIVNQAGKGQWRLRMYAGSDQVLKPAHIEEPLGIAMERILRIFNLKFEIFPGGKLIVVTGSDRFGYRGVE